MSDCQLCPVEKACHYPYKPCDCVHQRKFWSADRRRMHDEIKRAEKALGDPRIAVEIGVRDES